MNKFNHISDCEARRGLTASFLSVIEDGYGPKAFGDLFGRLHEVGFQPKIVAEAYTTAYALVKDIGVIAAGKV